MNATNRCPCGSEQTLAQCCGRFIQQNIRPQTAEQLMRSRYTAYVLVDIDYLEKTWHPDTCPDLRDDTPTLLWTRLEVIRHQKGLKKSIVEFKAYFEDNGSEQCMHEVSEFKKIKNRWYYVQAI